MCQCPLQNQRTGQSFDAVDRLTFWTHKFQLWILALQFCWIINQLRIIWAQFFQYILHLWDDIARFENHHRIAAAYIQPGNFVGVMQTGVLHRRTGHHYGVKHRHWRSRTCPANGDDDVADDGRGFFGSVFIGNRAARIFADHTQAVIQRSVVNFYHQTIGIKW